MNIDKLRKNTIPYNELEKKYMEDYEYQKEYLNLSLEEYITDGDFNKFYKSLEKVFLHLHRKLILTARIFIPYLMVKKFQD